MPYFYYTSTNNWKTGYFAFGVILLIALGLLFLNSRLTRSTNAVKFVDPPTRISKTTAVLLKTTDSPHHPAVLASAKWRKYAEFQWSSGRQLTEIILKRNKEKCLNEVSCSLRVLQQNWYDAVELLLSTPLNYRCDFQLPFGKGETNGQGPYKVCFDKPYRLTARNCLIYSFGIGDDWSFDDEMAQHGCEVFSFDPTIGVQVQLRQSGVRFFPYGLSSVDEELAPPGVGNKSSLVYKMRTLSSLHKLMQHQNRIIDVLKVDVEGAEDASFLPMIDSGFLDEFVKTILVEWHVSNLNTEKALLSFYRLHYEAGFESFYSENRIRLGVFYLIESLVNKKFRS